MMLCKIARTCVGFVARIERSARQKCIENRKYVEGIVKQTSGDTKTLKVDKRDHLVRTEGRFRQNEEMEGIVVDIETLSSSVRGLKLLISRNQSSSFKAGQWIDMIIPNMETVGGFSVCSPPHLFNRSSQLELAIKYSDHPPARWVHEQGGQNLTTAIFPFLEKQNNIRETNVDLVMPLLSHMCHIGSKVTIKFGGDFFYEPATQKTENVLLIAGGVGINPIYSILQERCKSEAFSNSPVVTKLLYSVKNEEDLLFKKDIEHTCKQMQQASCKFFITRQEGAQSGYLLGRIGLKTIKDSLDNLNERPICYICGPPNFIDSMVDNLLILGLQTDRIKFEKWW